MEVTRRPARSDADPAGLQKMLSLSIGRARDARRGAGRVARRLRSPRCGADAHDNFAERQRRGRRDGGMTALGGRPVQAVTPPEDAAKREAVRAPAAKTPEMTVPLPNAKTVKATPSVRSNRRRMKRVAGHRPRARSGVRQRDRRHRRPRTGASACRPAAVPARARRSRSPATSAVRSTWRS